MIKVIALQVGYDNVKLRDVGEEFEVPDNYFEKRPGKVWFEPVDPKLKAKYADRRLGELDNDLSDNNGTVHAVDPARQESDRAAELQRLENERQASERKSGKPSTK